MMTDGWTNMTMLIVAFRNFANAPKIVRSAHTVSCIDLTKNSNYFSILGAGMAQSV
jgi:hypothetical protein